MDQKLSKIFALFVCFLAFNFVVAASGVKAASFQLIWVDNSQNESGFNVERKLGANGTFSLIATVAPNVTSYSDGNLASNTTYCYRVNAFNDAGNSAYTNEACGTTPSVSPPPSGNTISTNIADGAVLSGSSVVWTATPSGSPVRVGFFIDGALLWTENVSPYQFNGDPSGTLNTNTLSNGSHQLKVRATYSDNSTAEQTVTVTVSNGISPTPPPTPTFDFSLTNGGSKSVTQGQSVTNAMTATLTTGSSQAVSFSTSGLPPGATASYTTSPSCNPTCSRTLTIATVASTPAGTSTITVTGAGGGVTRTTSFTLTVNPPAGSSPPPSSSVLTATLLGQTGEDIAGTYSETPDGIKDVHIRLSGVQSTITRVKIIDAGCNCIWETPYNGQGDWIVAIRPQTDPSVVDLYFDAWQQGSSYTLNLTFANGSTLTIQTSTLLSTASLSSDARATLTAIPVAGSTTAAFRTTANQLITKIGVFRPDTGEWFLDRNGNGQWDGCALDTCISLFGQPGDLPVIGSWSGARTSNIGTFSQTRGIWQLDRNGNGQWDGCSLDTCIGLFGQPGELPVTREISGFNRTIIGTFQPQQGLWKFDLNGNNTFDSCSVDECDENFGTLNDVSVAGDWISSGTEHIGVFRPSTGEWLLDVNGNGQWDGCRVDKCIEQFGVNGDLPVVGDWNGTGEVRIGVFRPSTGEWFLDMNGNGQFDGCAVDACLGPFGTAGDLPAVGKW